MSSRNILNQPVVDKSSALDIMFGFLQIAQSRGAFSFPESAKIYECFQQFSDFFQREEETPEEVEETNEQEDNKDEQNDEPTFPVETLGEFDDDDD